MFRISDVRVISLTVRSRNHLESNVSKFETDKFLSPMGRLCRYFLSLFLFWKEFFIPQKTLLWLTSMAKSKHQLACSLTKKTLTLEGKIKLLDPNKERKQSCQQLVEMFNISKTAAANIKNEASIRKEYEDLRAIWKGREKVSLMTLTKYCTSGLKNVVQQISILTDRCWKKKPWK